MKMRKIPATMPPATNMKTPEGEDRRTGGGAINIINTTYYSWMALTST